jgi:hypothetical protein
MGSTWTGSSLVRKYYTIAEVTVTNMLTYYRTDPTLSSNIRVGWR